MVGGRTDGRETQTEGYETRTWGGMDSSRPPTSVCSLAGVGSTPFPSLAPPITLLVDGKQQTLVICLVLDVAPPGFESPIWFSAGTGSSLDAFTYGPSPAEDGTWTRLAQLSLHSSPSQLCGQPHSSSNTTSFFHPSCLLGCFFSGCSASSFSVHLGDSCLSFKT